MVSNKILIKPNILLFFLILSILFLILLNPAIYSAACLNGILLWASIVLPSLFPFIFFTKILTQLEIDKIIGNKFKIFSKVYNLPPSVFFTFFLSILSGYPVGAKLVADSYESGQITREEAFRATTITSNSGPAFIVGSVGAGMLLDSKIGLIIFVSHVLGALLNGMLYRNYRITNNEKLITKNGGIEIKSHTPSGFACHPSTLRGEFIQNEKCVYNSPPSGGVDAIGGRGGLLLKKKEFSLADTMWNTVYSVLLIGGFIAVFFVIIEVLNNIGFFSSLSQIISSVSGASESVIEGVLKGFFEITRGSQLIAKTGLDIKIKTMIITGLVTFGGLATSLQAIAFLKKFNMRLGFFLKQKLTHTIFSVGICALLVFVFL